MNHNLVFSVIIPTYNREKLISRAIDSVLCQSFTDFELIIVDDGSVDNTGKIIDKYDDERIKYIYKENGGQNSALNVGIKEAKGKYLAFMDSDDVWLENKLQKIYEKYQSSSKYRVVYHSTGIYRRGKIIPINDDYLEGKIFKEVLKQGFMSSQISLSCEKKCMEDIGCFDEKFIVYQDDDVCFRLAKNYDVGLVKDVLSIIGGEADNRVTKNKIRTVYDYRQLIEKYEKDILKECGARILAKRYFDAAIMCLEVFEFDEAKRLYDNSIKCYRVNVFWNVSFIFKQKWMLLIKNIRNCNMKCR